MPFSTFRRVTTSVLVTKCGYYSSLNYDYKFFVKISDIKNSQPDGYILRIVLYIQGARDGNILLATSDHPNFERDFVYEFGKLEHKKTTYFHIKMLFKLSFSFGCVEFQKQKYINTNKFAVLSFLFLFSFFFVSMIHHDTLDCIVLVQ